MGRDYASRTSSHQWLAHGRLFIGRLFVISLHDTKEIVDLLSPHLAGSRPIVIYSAFKEVSFCALAGTTAPYDYVLKHKPASHGDISPFPVFARLCQCSTNRKLVT